MRRAKQATKSDLDREITIGMRRLGGTYESKHTGHISICLQGMRLFGIPHVYSFDIVISNKEPPSSEDFEAVPIIIMGNKVFYESEGWSRYLNRRVMVDIRRSFRPNGHLPGTYHLWMWFEV